MQTFFFFFSCPCKLFASHKTLWWGVPKSTGMQKCILPFALYLNLTNIPDAFFLQLSETASLSHTAFPWSHPRNCISSFLSDLRGDKALLTSKNEIFPVVSGEVSFSFKNTLLVLAKIMQGTPVHHRDLKEILSARIQLSKMILQTAVQRAE